MTARKQENLVVPSCQERRLRCSLSLGATEGHRPMWSDSTVHHNLKLWIVEASSTATTVNIYAQALQLQRARTTGCVTRRGWSCQSKELK